MARIKFTSALTRFFPDLKEVIVDGATIKEVITKVGNQYPGLTGYLLEEDGKLRQHVNIYIEENLIEDRLGLSDPVDENQEILIYQALSGG